MLKWTNTGTRQNHCDMSCVVAVDFGQKRCGFAITDELRIAASPLETVETKKAMDYLVSLIQKKKVVDVVVGKPTQKDGTPSPVEPAIQSFVDILKNKQPQIVVHRIDESYTSKMAAQALVAGGMKKSKRQEKGSLDKVSAAIILQSFLAQQDSSWI